MSATASGPLVGELVSFGRAVPASEGEFVPAALTIEVGRFLNMSLPLGAFTVREGKARFIPTVDIVGLVAVIMGIGVGRLAIRSARPIVLAVGQKIGSA